MVNGLRKLIGNQIMVPSCSTYKQMEYIAEQTNWQCIMLKMGDVGNIRSIIRYIHSHNKKVMIHLDSLKGIAKDKEGIRYLSRIGSDAVISMRAQNISMIKEAGMISLLGAFLVDSASVAQTILNVGNVKPDVLIAMPITIPDVVFYRLRSNMSIPIMGGGLGVSCQVIDHALEIGMEACAVTDREKLSHYTDRHLQDIRKSSYIETL